MYVTTCPGWGSASLSPAGIWVLFRPSKDRPDVTAVGVAKIVVVCIVVDSVPLLQLPVDIVATQVAELLFSVWLQRRRCFTREVHLQ